MREGGSVKGEENELSMKCICPEREREVCMYIDDNDKEKARGTKKNSTQENVEESKQKAHTAFFLVCFSANIPIDQRLSVGAFFVVLTSSSSRQTREEGPFYVLLCFGLFIFISYVACSNHPTLSPSLPPLLSLSPL